MSDSGFKLFSPLERKVASEKYFRCPSDENKEQFILSNYGLVASIVRKVCKSLNLTYSSDLEIDGFVGFIKALNSYCPDRNIQFSTFATPRIKKEIVRNFENESNIIRIPVHLQQAFRELRYIQTTFRNDTGRKEETIGELARYWGCDYQTLVYVYSQYHMQQVESIDVAERNSEIDNDECLLSDSIPDLSISVQDVCEAHEPTSEYVSFSDILHALELRSKKDQKILYEYLKLKSYLETAKSLGFSIDCVRKSVKDSVSLIRKECNISEDPKKIHIRRRRTENTVNLGKFLTFCLEKRNPKP